MTTALIDYGAGNLRSISNAIKQFNEKSILASTPEMLDKADRIILPGVGHFGNAMDKLVAFKDVIFEKIDEGIPFLGLCLGIQVLLDASEESPGASGLGIFKGGCKRFPGSVKIPHMGWNTLKIEKESKLLKDVSEDCLFYFVHSYYPEPVDDSIVVATTEYEVRFPSVIEKDNVFATQFHPEKSGKSGLVILKNFLSL